MVVNSRVCDYAQVLVRDNRSLPEHIKHSCRNVRMAYFLGKQASKGDVRVVKAAYKVLYANIQQA